MKVAKTPRQLLIGFSTFLLLPAYLFAAASLEQQSKDVQLLTRKFRDASGIKRTEAEEKLRAVVEQRHAELQALLTEKPEKLLELAIPKETYDLLPADLKNQVEHEIKLEGVVEQSQELASRAIIRFHSRQGARFTLYCVGAAPVLVKGSPLSIKGWQLDESLVASCGAENKVQTLSKSGAPAAALAFSFSHPRQGDVVRQTVEVRASLPAQLPTAAIGLYRDGKLLGRREAPPYAWSWNTALDPDGPHQLTLRGSDLDMNVGHASITLTVDNTPPRISLISPISASNVSGVVRFEAQASDSIGVDTLKFFVGKISVGALIQPPYALPWDTNSVPNGLHTVTAMARDRAGNETRSNPAEIRILNANTAPLLTPIGNKTVEEGTTLAFTVKAMDPNSRGEALAFSALQLPPWAVFDTAAQQFSGTPDFSTASSEKPTTVYPDVLFEVCDTQPTCAREAISITVKNINRPPVMNRLSDRQLNEGETLSITPLITEPDGDKIDCTAKLLPLWAGFDAKTCTLRGTPPLDTANEKTPVKTYKNVILKACDPENNCIEQAFNITVVDTVRKSKLELIGDKTVNEGRLLKFPVKAADPDRDPITLFASPLPLGAGFTDNQDGTGFFSWTPEAYQAGTYEIVFEAGGRDETDSETVVITVNETSFTISGLIQDTLGNPAAGITVEAVAPNTFTYTAVTNKSGIYILRDIKPNTYRVRPIHKSGTNLPGSRSETGLSVLGSSNYSFEPFYYQVEIKNADRRDLNFTAVSRD